MSVLPGDDAVEKYENLRALDGKQFRNLCKKDSRGFAFVSKPGNVLIIPADFAVVSFVQGDSAAHGLRWSLLGSASMASASSEVLSSFLESFPIFEGTAHERAKDMADALLAD